MLQARVRRTVKAHRVGRQLVAQDFGNLALGDVENVGRLSDRQAGPEHLENIVARDEWMVQQIEEQPAYQRTLPVQDRLAVTQDTATAQGVDSAEQRAEIGRAH